MEEIKNNTNIKDVSISNEMETSFIDYAMSVIVSRAIPDSRDGLKPVHRRILYAMNGLEMTHNKSFKKSARAVGEVIAKYHPHGDTAVYDSMVRMAQPFSLRYPLILGQGNFGSIDGDSAAAMRYTEAKLMKISSLMLEDINKDTVDFQDNYDGSEVEPKVLPGKIPNLLLNGTTGIAVGMATSIPPHNLDELIDASIALAKDSSLEINDLLNYVKGPDFPTGAMIVNKNELYKAYSTGNGRVVIRSKVDIEFNEKTNAGRLIVREIPYMVNKSSLVLKIAQLVKSKTIDSISDITDESNRKGIRVVIKLKKGFIPEVELNKLFKLTQLQSTFSVNILALVNERPRVLNLKESIQIYIDHQIDILVRKTKYSLKKAEEKKHILEGLKIALDNIDEVIEIIRNSADNKIAAERLKERFKLSDIQVKAILEMRLQRLTGLERDNLDKEIAALVELIDDLNDILNSNDRRIKEIVSMMERIKDVYGDSRRTEVSSTLIGNIEDEDLIPQEDIIVTLSKEGYIKRIPVDEYRTQNRGGVGSSGVKTKEEDDIADILFTNTHTDLLFFTSYGKVYKIRAHQLPNLTKQSKGIPAINIIQIEKEEKIKSIIEINEYNEENSLVFATKKGIVKKTFLSEFERVNKNGKRALTLREEDELIGVSKIENINETEILLGNSNGKANRFNSSKIRNMGRTASGVKGMEVADDEEIIGFSTSENGDYVLSLSEHGFGKLTKIDDYRITNRGGKGVKTINANKAGKLVGLTSVSLNEELMIVTNKGTVIRIPISQISTSGRDTKGVKIVKLKDKEFITSLTIIKGEKEILS